MSVAFVIVQLPSPVIVLRDVQPSNMCAKLLAFVGSMAVPSTDSSTV